MKLLFFGTPALAVPFLEDCADAHEVVGVVCRPDKPSGRKMELKAPPVKEAALGRGLQVFQPKRPSEIAADLKALDADLGVAVAYGRILKRDVLDAPKQGLVNVHFSRLPKYRGAAPIAWALVNGERETGVSIFWLDEGMDTGPLLAERTLAVGPEEDATGLTERLVSLGRAVLREALALVEAGRAPRRPQSGEPSPAPMLKKEDGRVSWDMDAKALHDRVRGLRMWPRAFVKLGGKRVQLLRTRAVQAPGEASPGAILKVEPGNGFLVKCGLGAVWVLDVQPDGRGPMPGASFLNGFRLKVGDRLS